LKILATNALVIVSKWMRNTKITHTKWIVSIQLFQTAIKRTLQCKTETRMLGTGATIAAQEIITVLKGITAHLGIP